jgi:hypothetical protein
MFYWYVLYTKFGHALDPKPLPQELFTILAETLLHYITKHALLAPSPRRQGVLTLTIYVPLVPNMLYTKFEKNLKSTYQDVKNVQLSGLDEGHKPITMGHLSTWVHSEDQMKESKETTNFEIVPNEVINVWKLIHKLYWESSKHHVNQNMLTWKLKLVCRKRRQGHYNDRRICGKMTLNEQMIPCM